MGTKIDVDPLTSQSVDQGLGIGRRGVGGVGFGVRLAGKVPQGEENNSKNSETAHG